MRMIVPAIAMPYVGIVPSKRATTRVQAEPIGAATVTLWRDRRAAIQGKLIEHEQAEWAWLWRTRLSVLDFLIHRYDTQAVNESGRDSASRAEQPDRQAQAREAREESVSPYNHRPVDGTSRIADHKKQTIQSRLASLHRANAQRYVEAERSAEEMRDQVRAWQRSIHLKKLGQSRLAEALDETAEDAGQTPGPVAEDDSDRLRLADALNGLDEREYKALRRFIAFDLGLLEYTDEPLDDETIRMILTEHGIDPSETS